mmetsp:Transcript_381/g.465  ORF Transcript_381/g.465 Transcript_381/m.465 type:complete len:103 (-) Transcript_381:369-677(-)
MHAIRNKRLDSFKYILYEVGGIDLLAKNNMGMTVLHLAIKSNMIQFVKYLFIKEIDSKYIDETTKLVSDKYVPTFDDIKGNVNPKAIRLLKTQNLKGMVPLV